MALVIDYRFGTCVAFWKEIKCMPWSTLSATEFISFMLRFIWCDFDTFMKSFREGLV
jgi:hypothetical protein